MSLSGPGVNDPQKYLTGKNRGSINQPGRFGPGGYTWCGTSSVSPDCISLRPLSRADPAERTVKKKESAMKVLLRRSLALPILASLIAATAQAQVYSDKDKKKMAEIAQKPEVQEQVSAAFQNLSRQDMEFAYIVNTSTRLGEITPTQLVEFRTKFGQLYDNPMLQQYVNTVGQRLVPKDSPHLYAFRLLLDPVPRAEALSTGTIFISTGLVALLDNEAQLSYVLAHEMAHIEQNHFLTKIRNAILEQELAKEKQLEAQKKRTMFAALGAAAGAIAGGAAGGAQWAGIGAMAGGLGGYTLGAVMYRNKLEPTEWEKEMEDEADEAAVKHLLEQNYDVRQIPPVYARLDQVVSRDARVGLGFAGNPKRVKERTAHVQNLLSGAYKADIDKRLGAGGLVASGPNFALLMFSLKRDNGVIAMEYDLFAMAKDNLEEAASFRSNDPRVHTYLGRLLALTGRTPEEKQQAAMHFARAIQYDAERGAYPEPHLENALYLLAQNDPSVHQDVLRELKTYVAVYQREHGGRLPGNMHILYDYAELVGDTSWYVAPIPVVQNVSQEQPRKQ